MEKCLKFRRTVFFLIVAGMFVQLTSCGSPFEKTLNSKPVETLSYVSNQVFCEQGEDKKALRPNKTIESLYRFADQSGYLVRDYKRAFPGQMINVSLGHSTSSELTPDNPLRLSQAEFDSSLEDLKNRLSLLLTHSSFVHFTENHPQPKYVFEFSSAVTKEMFEKIVFDLQERASRASRFHNYQCDLNRLAENEIKDVRPYLKLSRIKDSFKLMSESQLMTLKSDLMAICRPLEGSSQCEALFFQFQRNQNLSSLFTTMIEEYQIKIYQNYFKLRKWRERFQCQQEGEKTILTLNLSIDPEDAKRFPGGIDGAIRFAEALWSHQDFSLKINLIQTQQQSSPSHAFHLVFQEGVISHVRHGLTKEIILDSRLNHMTMIKTFTHELGHVFGFPDCYIEFFSHDSQEIIYYELDRENGNMMCSVDYGYQFPADYLNQLKDEACRD